MNGFKALLALALFGIVLMGCTQNGKSQGYGSTVNSENKVGNPNAWSQITPDDVGNLDSPDSETLDLNVSDEV